MKKTLLAALAACLASAAAHAQTFHRGGPMFVVRETILKD